MRIHTQNKAKQLSIAAFVLLLLSTLIAGPILAQDITDAQITNAVEEAFSQDSAVPFDNIDVETNEGIVTLSGEVNNLLAKERATNIAEIVKGVRAVTNQIAVQPSADLSPDQIHQSVKNALIFDPATERYEVDIQVDEGGVVTLRGTVDSWQEHNLVEKVVKGVVGVTEVNNAIQLDYATERTDEEIETEIEERLRWDTLVDHALIGVQVEDGAVSLSGVVGSAAEKRRARMDGWVAGVESVQATELEVARWRRDEDLRSKKYVVKSDEEIRHAVLDALWYDPRLTAFKINVEVFGGVVTLSGTVDNVKAKYAAAQDARNTVGVARVKNLLKVRPAMVRSDAEIAEDVRAALSRDPYVEKYEILVDVSNGTVSLSGSVDTAFEKAQAEDITYRAKGVVAVRNHLRIHDNRVIASSPYIDTWDVRDFRWQNTLTPSVFKSDFEIEAEIENQLLWSPFVDAEDVSVSVEGGAATLSGRVDSWSEYHAAWRNAFDGGATRVRNNLVVGAAPRESSLNLFAGFLLALIVALLLTLIFGAGLGRTGPWVTGPGEGLLWFFLIVFLVTWAGGVWIVPFGPTMWGIALLPFLIIGVLVAVLLAASAPARPRGLRKRRSPGTNVQESSAAATLGLFFWMLIIGLALSLVIGYTV